MVVEQVELSTANWQDFLRRPTKTLRVMSKSEFVALKKRNPKEQEKGQELSKDKAKDKDKERDKAKDKDKDKEDDPYGPIGG